MPAGTAAPMSRTGSAGMDGLKRKKTAREGTPEPKKVKEHSQLQAKEHTQQQGKNWSYWCTNTVQLRRSWRFQVWWNEVFPTTQSSAETVTVPQVQFLIRMVNVPARNNNKDKWSRRSRRISLVEWKIVNVSCTSKSVESLQEKKVNVERSME